MRRHNSSEEEAQARQAAADERVRQTLATSGPFCLVEPRVACPQCSQFIDSVMGFRSLHQERRVGRRPTCRAGRHRDGAVMVGNGPVLPPAQSFFDLLRDETCARWLDHLADLDDPGEHVRELPAWVARLLKPVDFRRIRASEAPVAVRPMCCGRQTVRRASSWWCAWCRRTYKPRRFLDDAATHVAAGLLGMSPRSYYRRGERS